jgi:hypothetical protein
VRRIYIDSIITTNRNGNNTVPHKLGEEKSEASKPELKLSG